MNIKSKSAAAFVAALVFAGCNMDSSSSNSNDTDTTVTTSSSSGTLTYTSASNAEGENTEDSSLSDQSFANTIYLDLSALTYSTDGSDTTEITSSKATVTDSITIKNEDGYITLDASKSTGASQVTVTGTYTGTLKIKAGDTNPVNLVLNGTDITSTNYPCISVTGSAATFLSLTGTNTITDGRKYGYGYGADYASTGDTPSVNYVEAGEDTKGTLYVKGDLRISGEGTLTVNEGYKHGIASKSTIYVYGGTVNVNSTGRNCIQSTDGFIMYGGTLNLSGTGTHTNNQSRGIVVEGAENGSSTGFIKIYDGSALNITSVSKAITAKWDVDEDAETTETSDDPDPSIYISGGTFVITTTGTPADESSSTYTFTDADGVYVTETTKLSPEGIEGKNGVYISGGTFYLNTTDDAINAGNEIEISGGFIYAYSSKNDAIDSNGTLTISGGYTVAIGLSSAECALDCDNNTFKVTGGTFFGIGTNNYSTPTSSVCTQNVFIASSSYTGTSGNFAVCDSSGNTAFAFTFPSISSSGTLYALFSSPEITSGKTYSLIKGCTVSGGESFKGLYYTLPSVSGGSTTASKSVTSSTKVYSFSSSNDMSNNGPNHR